MRNRFVHALTLFTLLAAYAAGAHALLPIEHWQTSRGAKVYFVQNRDLPMLDVSVDFPAGAGFDTPDKAGRANLTAHLLRLGTEGMDENEISQRLADVGAQLSGRFDSDRGGAGVRTLSSERERTRAVEVLARILSAPAFAPEVLAREKVRLIGALKEADTRPDAIAAHAFSRMVYPAHPYGLRNSGEVETVSALTREDLLAFHQRHYTAGRAIVAIMGDVSREQAGAIAEALTSRLPETRPGAPTLPPVTALPAGQTRWIAHPATQSHIMMGAPGMSRTDPDYFALFVGNHVLGGGGFTSRITEEVRQKRGLAYAAYSYFSPMLQAGPFVVGMQTQGSQAPEALEVVRRTVSEFVRNGPTARELAVAKKNIVGGFPLRIDSNRKIHEYLAVIGFYGLPLDYLDQFTRNVEAVTVEQVRAAFQRHLDVDRMITVVVGEVDDKAATAASPSVVR